MKLRSKSLRTTLEAVTSLGKNRGWNHRCSQELETLGQPEDDMEEKKNLELNGIEVAFITAGNVRRSSVIKHFGFRGFPNPKNP